MFSVISITYQALLSDTNYHNYVFHIYPQILSEILKFVAFD